MNGSLQCSTVAIRLIQWESVKKWETLQTHSVMKVAVFSHLQAAIGQMEHLELGQEQHLARWNNQYARNLHNGGIEREIHCVPDNTDMYGNEEADGQVILTREGHRAGTVPEGVCTSGANKIS